MVYIYTIIQEKTIAVTVVDGNDRLALSLSVVTQLWKTKRRAVPLQN